MSRKLAPALPPNYTQSPNVFYDEWLPEIDSLSEIKVVELVIRYTFGWHVQEVLLSLSDIRKLTRMSEPSVIEAVKRALDHEYICRVQRGASYGYRLNVTLEDQETLDGKLMALRFKRQSDGEIKPEKILLDNAAPKDSLEATPKESLGVTPPAPKEVLGVTPKESLGVPLKDFKEPYKDKESLNKSEINTHTPRSGIDDEQREAKAGVGVYSKFSLRQRLEWARWRAGLSGSTIRDPDAVALARADGQADELIEEYLSRTPEQAAEKARAPSDTSMTFFEAAQIVNSMIQCGRNLQEAVDSLPDDVSENVRRKVIEEFSLDKQAVAIATSARAAITAGRDS